MGEQARLDQEVRIEGAAGAGDTPPLGHVIDVRGLLRAGAQVGQQQPEPGVARLRIGRQPHRRGHAAASSRPICAQWPSSADRALGRAAQFRGRVKWKTPAALAMAPAAWK